jgi:epoxyqueuosine reductase
MNPYPTAALLTTKVKQLALAQGFFAVGITDTAPLVSSGKLLDRWLDKSLHGTMTWMVKTRHERRDPQAFFPCGKSAIVVALNYFCEPTPVDAEVKYARYAVGRDYHKVIKSKLKKLSSQLKELLPDIKTRACVDSFPLLEKPLAQKAGLGWIGKNTNLIIKGKGSFFF